MLSLGAKVRDRRPLQRVSALPLHESLDLPSTQYSVLSTSLSIPQWRPTRLLSNQGAFEITRASAPADLGPGCYVLKTAKSNNSIARALLRREALVARQINHPNLIAVLAADSEAQIPHLVLPYLEGITLRRLLDSSSSKAAAARQSLPVTFALFIVRQIASALAAMHAAGWLHGEIRPEHIVISPQGQATLIDLTHARRLESSECDATGELPSSPLYAAPEMASSRDRFAAAADAYSLGVVLYETLAGQPPFQSPSPQELLRLQRRAAPPDLRQLRQGASLEVSQLCRLLLAKEPLRRPDAAQTLRWLTELEIEELRGVGF